MVKDFGAVVDASTDEQQAEINIDLIIRVPATEV